MSTKFAQIKFKTNIQPNNTEDLSDTPMQTITPQLDVMEGRK